MEPKTSGGYTRQDNGKNESILYVGIDLGTSRTSISASNGVRETVSSVVGYPRDVVSRKLLQRDILFGDDALKNRLALDVYRPLEKGVIKHSDSSASSDEVEANMEAARALIQHAVGLARPKPGQLVYGVIGCPAQASIHNKQSIIEAAREVLDSVVICSEPFSVAYGLERLQDCMVIDIGAGTTDLCRMKGSMPDEDDQITLTQAGDFVDNQLFELFKTRCPDASFNVNMVRDVKEQHAFVTEASEPVLVTFPVRGKPKTFDVTAEIRKGCTRIVEPIVEAVDRLISTFDPEFQDRLRKNVILAGGGSRIHGLDRAIEEALAPYGGGRVRSVQEPVYAGANGALKIAYDMPVEAWEQLA
ncbi:MAG: rod shape-determining protein [Planctomycetes bacterium]|nr:rod shape-determining protein [Planctomycetota bacterium]